MNDKQKLKLILITGLVCTALGGWLLHLRIHTIQSNPSNYLPFLSGIFSIIILPLMFYFRPTVTYAYILNGMTVIIGTITMAHFSIANLPPEITLGTIILRTTFADIMLLFTKLFIGKAIFDLNTYNPEGSSTIKGRFFRYPNMGFWWVHLFAMSVVYTLGHVLWR
ncbi:MAG: hypothetical protein LHV68_11715 [Elusimicrobia bacterium]|nr:hypothetical protein [Candidatus Liberimonas magnetica]